MSLTTHRGRIVLIDDDREMRSLLKDFLVGEGYQLFEFSGAREALAALQTGGMLASHSPQGEIDLVVSDIKMPQMDGLELTTRLRQERPEIPVILITAFGSIETAIEALQRGAFHYVVKPFKLAEIKVTIERAIEHRKLQLDNTALRTALHEQWSLGGMIGKSPAMRTLFDLIRRVSQAQANVLITGESGTGKEKVARAIHETGSRKSAPFIAINCAAIPESLLESELFGHAKGAFTGAIGAKKGLFESAQGGTLFLDEIGDMPISLQAKLLRVIQDKRVRAVGENTDREIDIRLVCATHRDLKALVREEKFREDLYYRINVIKIEIPPLRHRSEDVPLLADFFLKKYAAINHSPARGFSKKAMTKLLSHPFHGNVRELENLIERAVVLSAKPILDEEDLPVLEHENTGSFLHQMTSEMPSLAQIEQKYIQFVLEKTGGKKDKTAHILGINRRTLYRKEREYGLAEYDPAQEDLTETQM